MRHNIYDNCTYNRNDIRRRVLKELFDAQRVALCLRIYLNDVEHEGALEVLGDIDVRIVQNVLQAMHASLE